MKQTRAWIFVSHSTQDLDAVRCIRDYLEKKGTNPILFFLKCVSETDELDSLIKREIAARNFFVLCDSPNARLSKWVQEEVTFVKEQPDIQFCEVDLSLGWEEQEAVLASFLPATRVFVSCSFAELQQVKPFVNALAKADYSVFFPSDDLMPGDNWQDKIQQEIFAAADTGLMVCFLSDRSLSNPNTIAELGMFVGKQGGKHSNLLLVVFDDVTQPLPFDLNRYQVLRLAGSANEQMERFVNAVRQLKP